MKKSIRKILKKRKSYKYHVNHKNSAMKILKSIETEKGKTNLKNIRLSREYANDILGGVKYAPWLYVYTAMAGEFKEGWIPANYFGYVVVPKLKGDYFEISDRNMITNSLLKLNNSLDICYYVNNLLWSIDYKVLDKKKIKDLLFENNKSIVYKVENSQQGRGVYFFNKENFRFLDLIKLGNGVFQTYINQHRFFSEFTELSVATIRITSSCDDNGEILVNSAYLRIGQNNDTHVKSPSALKIPINVSNGQLSKYGYFPDWTSTEIHPDRKVAFKDKVIPSFQNCITEVLRMHSSIPFIRCIGWDVIVDNFNDVRLIEWNSQVNDITFSEATQGPCFKELHWENLR